MLVFSRYVGVQVVAYAIDLGTFVAASSWLGIDPLSSNVAAKICAGIVAFLAHRSFTFRVAGRGGGRRQLVRYAALLALNVPIASAILALLMPWITPPALAKVVADVICVAITFWLSRHAVFTVPSNEEPGT